MRINISWLRAHYPEQFGIRKFLQKMKVNRITRYTLSKSEIEICEADSSKKEMIIAPYLQKWEKYLRPCISEMNAIIEKSPIFSGGVRPQESQNRYVVLQIGLWVHSFGVYRIWIY